MVRLRSQRYGSKKSPFYRIVATDSRNPRDGRFIEVVGTYDPLTNPATVKDRKSTRLNSSHREKSRMPSSA